MANNKFYGYTPDSTKEAEGNRLDRLNPYEFRKGMDYELTSAGCSRLAESTLEEREKATESVLKNLEENGGYYTSLITYETTYRNSDDKPTFKKWLSEQEDFKMKEVDEKFDNDKMVALKETIKTKVREMMQESLDGKVDDEVKVDLDGIPTIDGEDFEQDTADVKADIDSVNEEDEDEVIANNTSIKNAKFKGNEVKSIENEIQKLKDEKEKNMIPVGKALEKYKAGKFNKKEFKSAKDEYVAVTKEKVEDNKEIVVKIKQFEKDIEDIQLTEKMGRREVAKTMMEKETHMELLTIMKEGGVNLREGADSLKQTYEIAKTAYQEGFMAGLKK